MTLKELGFKHRTDKANHGFLDTYDDYLSKLKNVNRVLEIGVRTGASLRMWGEYFLHAIIDGVDINPDCLKHANGNSIRVFIGDQTDTKFLDTLEPVYDFIIDDGSHVNKWTVETFNYLFPRLKKGGIYILEDMQYSYQDLQKVNVREKWSGMKLVPIIPIQRRETIDDLIIRLSYKVDQGQIESVNIHKGFIVIVK